MTNDGKFSYSWDGENRMTNMISLSAIPTAAKVELSFAYDYMGRRIQKIIWTNNGTSYFPLYTNRYVYDGWNVIGILTPSSQLQNSFMWGTDLSGSSQGAGGVGGLLESSYYGSIITNCFVAYDGNGNVTALVNAKDGTVAANYGYGPFGEPIQSNGLMAKNNPLMFSTKYYDREDGNYNYGHRYYDPSNGRWDNRDFLEEEGGNNLYEGIRNDPINNFDSIGDFSLEDIVLSQLNGGVSVARTFPVGAIGPVPIFATVGIQGKIFKCDKSGQKQWWGEVDGFVELYGKIGIGYDDRARFTQPKGRDRNQRIPDPNNPGQTAKQKDLAGKLVDPSGKFRDRSGFVDILKTESCECPNEDVSGSINIFLRGSAGIGFIGAQFNIQKTLLSTEDIGGAQFSAGVAYGVTGASIEAGGNGELKYTGPVPYQGN